MARAAADSKTNAMGSFILERERNELIIEVRAFVLRLIIISSFFVRHRVYVSPLAGFFAISISLHKNDVIKIQENGFAAKVCMVVPAPCRHVMISHASLPRAGNATSIRTCNNTSIMPSAPDDPLTVARRILLSSPPGEFDLVLEDLQKVLPSGAGADEQFIAETRRLYGEQTGSRLIDGGGNVGGGGEHCAKLRSKMDGYMAANYCASSPPSSGSGYAVSPAAASSANDDSLLTLEVYAEKVSAPNCHSGSWHATYTIEVLSSTSATIGGTVRLRSHEYEDMANVQLSSTHALDQVTVSAKTGQDWSDAVLTQIQTWERDNVQGYLAKLYDDEVMNNGMLRSMRRVLPVTKSRMDWNMGGHRLVKTLNDTKKR